MTPSTPAPAPERTINTGRVIALLVVSAFVVILNETIMGVALPRLMVDLDITASTAQWLTTGFLLTMAIVIPATGYLLQRFHVRTLFFTAMGLFTAGTIVAAMAPGFAVLLLGRVIQASGTAVMMPLLMTTVLTVVPPEKRGRTMGVISIVISVAPAIGPTVSGLILQSLDWRWMFIVMVPLAITSIVLGSIWVQNVTEPRAVAFDVLSIVLSAFAFGGLIYGLSSIGEAAEGEAPVPIAIPLVVGSVALVLFLVRQLQLQRADRALLDLRTFQSGQFSIGIAMVAISMAALFGTLILLPIYLQQVVGLDTLDTGLLMLPGGVTMGLLAPLVGRAFDRVGPRPLVVPGAIVVSATLWWMTFLNESSTVREIIAMHVCLHIGFALLFTPLMTSALGSLRVNLYSHGSAIFGTIQQVAGAAGTALFITTMSVVSASRLSDGQDAVAATSAGVTGAITWGAALSLITVVLAFFVRRPLDSQTTQSALPEDEASATLQS